LISDFGPGAKSKIQNPKSKIMQTRPLSKDDRPALEELLIRRPSHTVFHLSALAEYGLGDAANPAGLPWAVGAFRGEELSGVVMALRGTGGIYHEPGDDDTLHALAGEVAATAAKGTLSLLSGHASQIGPLLPLIDQVGVGPADDCHFRTIQVDAGRGLTVRIPRVDGFGAPRQATLDDMERLVDFYEVGFYSLARLPTRAAWRNRMTEQLNLRTLFLVEDSRGRVASAALSSAEGGGAAMLGGVATLSEYRGKGLSALCVGALCEHLARKGFAGICLFYLKDNIPASRVYDKLGFQDAGEWLLAPLGLGASFLPLLRLG
jgi:GNAT superfamily N-acetyltransferase